MAEDKNIFGLKEPTGDFKTYTGRAKIQVGGSFSLSNLGQSFRARRSTPHPTSGSPHSLVADFMNSFISTLTLFSLGHSAVYLTLVASRPSRFDAILLG